MPITSGTTADSIALSFLGYAVRQFYDNGGADAYVIRISADDDEVAEAAIGDLTVRANSSGEWANEYRVRLTRRTDDATRFKLEVLHEPSNNAVVESFPNLSMSGTDPRFVDTVINGKSAFIAVEAGSATTPADATVDLDDATAGAAGTLIGPDDASFRTALTALFDVGSIADRIDLFNLLCVPALRDAPTIATLQHICRDRRAFLIVDGPNEPVASVSLTGLTGSDAMNSAFFYPPVLAPDPLQEGAIKVYPACGFVAGVFARTDATRGVWKAPAGSEASINGAAGLTITMSDAENGQLNPRGINCLRTLPVYGNVVWGSRTLHGDNDRASEWKYIPVRRLALFLEESLYRGTQWVVFEPNDEPLWAQIRLNIGAFMQNLFRQGAFQGTSPRDAYFVKCDKDTTTQTDINLGIVNIVVGFAPLKPAEFVVIKIQQIAGNIPT